MDPIPDSYPALAKRLTYILSDWIGETDGHYTVFSVRVQPMPVVERDCRHGVEAMLYFRDNATGRHGQVSFFLRQDIDQQTDLALAQKVMNQVAVSLAQFRTYKGDDDGKQAASQAV